MRAEVHINQHRQVRLLSEAMKTPIITAVLAALAWAAPIAAQGPAQLSDSLSGPFSGSLSGDEPLPTADDGRGTPFVVDKSDSICGIDEPRALTNPAKVDYDALLKSTPEVKRMKKRKIDRDSAEGIRLLSAARRKVLSACESVRSSEGHDSVWKKIKRRDQRAVADITRKVKAEIAAGDKV